MKHFYTFLLFLCTLSAYAQVGIGTGSPDPSAQLEINSTDKGLLIPRVTQANRPGSPGKVQATPGLVIYQTDGDPGFYAFDNGNWGKLKRLSDTTYIDFYKAYNSTSGLLYLSPPLPRAGWPITYVNLQFTSSSGIASATANNNYTITKPGTYLVRYKVRPNTTESIGVWAGIFVNESLIEDSVDIDNYSNTPTVTGECIVTLFGSSTIRIGLRSPNAIINRITIPGGSQGAYLSVTKLN